MAETDLQRDKTITRAVHRLFWRAMWQDKLMLFLSYGLHLPSFYVFNLLIPLQVAYGLQAILTHHLSVVHHQALVVIISTLIAGIVFAIATWANHRLNLRGAGYVQNTVFSNYLSKDYEFYSSNYIGALGKDANDLRSAFQAYELMMTFAVPKSAVIIVAGLGIILYKSLLLGVASTACVVLVLGVSIFIATLRLKYRREVSQTASRLAGRIGDPLSHGEAVISFAQEDAELQRIQEPLQKWQKAVLRMFDTSIPHHFIRHMMLALTMAGLLIISGNLYYQGKISIALVALVQLYVIRVVNTSIEIGEIIKEYEGLMSDAYEPMATMLVPSTVLDPEKPKKLAIKPSLDVLFQDVTYHYPEAAKNSKAVKDFSLSVAAGEKIGLVGHSGGGKTTVTKLLLRFMDVTQGSIEIDGQDIRGLKQDDLRQAIAYVPQDPVLFHRSIRENIVYANPAAGNAAVEAVAKTAYVDEFVKDLPQGYESMVGERGVKLSGGQRQRVAIARALLKNAPILVLDEATSALDSQSEQYIQKALWQLMEDRTAIVIAHRLSTIQRMDRIVVMDRGQIAQIGTHPELLQDKKGAYARLWAHQSGGYLA